MQTVGPKAQVREFWSRSSCGEVYAEGETLSQQLERQAQARYELEPALKAFAKFPNCRGRDVLEIGVGMGADHLEWAKSGPRSLTGIDLTDRAVEFTRARLASMDLARRFGRGMPRSYSLPTILSIWCFRTGCFIILRTRPKRSERFIECCGPVGSAGS